MRSTGGGRFVLNFFTSPILSAVIESNPFCNIRKLFANNFWRKGLLLQATNTTNSLSSRATALPFGFFCFLLLFFGFCRICLILPCLNCESEPLDLLNYPRGFKASLCVADFSLMPHVSLSSHLALSLARQEWRRQVPTSHVEYYIYIYITVEA